MNKGVAETLAEAAKLETVEERAEYLKNNNSPALQTALYYCYHDEISWKLPDTDPPYTPRGKEEDLQNVFKKNKFELILLMLLSHLFHLTKCFHHSKKLKA